VIDLRIYRAAMLPALCALVVVMFSVESEPPPRRALISPDNFDRVQAARLTTAVINAGPQRAPGSRGDAAAADLVEEQFRSIQADQVSIQRFRGTFRGDDVDLENIVLVLPGDSDGRIVLMAHRDSASGAGATTSASATGTMLALAHAFANVDHHKTLVFVSTDGGSIGGTGADQFARNFPGAESVDAAIVVSAPGVDRPQRPFLAPWSTSSDSTSAQLVGSAASAIEDQLGRGPGLEGAFGHLARLALPSGLGEGAVLIGNRLDAVEITATGDRLPPVDDTPERISTETIDSFGRAALSLVLALDVSDRALDHGPDAYVRVGGKLVPGWALRLLALALLLPVGAVAIDAIARASRRGEPVLRHLSWIAARALPFGAALVLAYVLAFFGLVPDPGFPFDPGRFEIDAGAVVVLVLLAASFGSVWALLKPLRLPPTLSGEGVGAALALVLFVASVGIWLANPYMALLLVPAANMWTLAAFSGTGLRPLPAALVGIAGLLLPFCVVVHLAGRWEVGWGVPWDLLLMVTGGHLGFATAVLCCLLAACLTALAAIVAAGRPRAEPGPAGAPDRAPRRASAARSEAESALTRH
jgi:hypothetical protein